MWFADIARKINRPLERIEALEQALQFTKNNAKINNQLAVEYILQGKEEIQKALDKIIAQERALLQAKANAQDALGSFKLLIETPIVFIFLI